MSDPKGKKSPITKREQHIWKRTDRGGIEIGIGEKITVDFGSKKEKTKDFAHEET